MRPAGAPLALLLTQLADFTKAGVSAEVAVRAIVIRDQIPLDDESLPLCVLNNWQIAKDLGLLTPENLDRMRAGIMPQATKGHFSGMDMVLVRKPVNRLPPRFFPTTFQLVLADQAPKMPAEEPESPAFQSSPDPPPAPSAQRAALGVFEPHSGPVPPVQAEPLLSSRSSPPPASLLFECLQKSRVDDAARPFALVLAEMADLTKMGLSPDNAARNIIALNQIPSDDRSFFLLLLANWQIAKDLGLLTPENLVRLVAGRMPRATRGRFTGSDMVLVKKIADPPPLHCFPATFRLTPAEIAPQLPAEEPQWPPVEPSTEITHAPPFGSPGGGPRPPPFAPKVTYVEVKPDQPVKTMGTDDLFINSADKRNGVAFAVVDPTKAVRVTNYISDLLGSHPGSVLIPNTKYFRAAWADNLIPGTKDKGTFLIQLNGMRYYLVNVADFEHTTFRVAISNLPLPAGSNPPPDAPRDFDRRRR